MIFWIVRGAGRRPAGRQGKWSWQARLILLGVIVAVAAQWPAGRVALAIIGGGIVFLFAVIIVWGLSTPTARRRGQPADRPVNQEGPRR